MLFEWDDEKRLENLRKHGIDFLDFLDAKEIWHGEVLEVPSDQEHGEPRHLAYGGWRGGLSPWCSPGAVGPGG